MVHLDIVIWMNMDTEFVATSRGGKKLVHKGYAYVVNRTGANHTYWRCEKRKLCNASRKMKGDMIKGDATQWQHSHPPDPARCMALKEHWCNYEESGINRWMYISYHTECYHWFSIKCCRGLAQEGDISTRTSTSHCTQFTNNINNL